MGGALRRPTKFDCGAALQQSSNIFYQKFVEINSVGGRGEEKGFKGKGNRRSRLRFARPPSVASLPAKFFAPKIKNKKETRLAQPTHPRVSKYAPQKREIKKLKLYPYKSSSRSEGYFKSLLLYAAPFE